MKEELIKMCEEMKACAEYALKNKYGEYHEQEFFRNIISHCNTFLHNIKQGESESGDKS